MRVFNLVSLNLRNRVQSLSSLTQSTASALETSNSETFRTSSYSQLDSMRTAEADWARVRRSKGVEVPTLMIRKRGKSLMMMP